jgi:multiple sugar transport system permease protein
VTVARPRPHPHPAAPARPTADVFWTIRRREILGKTITYLLLTIAVLLILFPIYWMVITSFKLPREIFRVPSLWPQVFTWNNYKILLEQKDFLIPMRNSLIVASTVTVTSLLVSSLAAYSIVRFRYPGRTLVGRLILFAYLTPTSLLFIPLSILMAQLQLGNSIFGLVVVYLTFSIPLGTWLLQGYFRAVPRELEEQGMIDGLSRLGALFRIVLPLSAPGLAAVAIFTFTGAWNELLLALVLVTSESQRTAPLALNYLITSDVLPWGPLMAGAVISSFPLMVLYFVAQRFMVTDLTAGSVKG